MTIVLIPIIHTEWIPNSDLVAREYVPSPHFQGQGIWITVTNFDDDINNKLPKLYSVYSLGCLYTTSCYMVQYRPVDTDKLRTITLTNNNNSSNSLSESFSEQTLGDTKSNSNKMLSESAQNYSIDGLSGKNGEKYLEYESTDLEFIVAQINSGHDLFITVRNYLNKNDESMKSKNSASCSESVRTGFIKMIELPIILISWFWFIVIYNFRRIMDFKFLNVSNILFGHWPYSGYLGCCIRGSLKTSVPKNISTVSSYTSLSDNFLVFHCLSEKFQIMENILLNCEEFVKSWKRPSIKRHEIWVNVNSVIVVIIMDVLLGTIFGYFLFRYSQEITDFCTETAVFLQSDILRATIEGLKRSPYGIKLNPLITKKIGYVLKLLIRECGILFSFTSPLHVCVVQTIGCAGAVGISLQLSLIIDTVRLLTLHILLTYKVTSYTHRFQCKLIISLFHLFRGQKINILRHRLDTCEYDKIQLLFGVVFFAMAFFLFPSFAAYFYLFSLSQLLILILQSIFLSLIVLVRDFPYYCLVIGFLEPMGITNGLRFHLMQLEADANTHSNNDNNNDNNHNNDNYNDICNSGNNDDNDIVNGINYYSDIATNNNNNNNNINNSNFDNDINTTQKNQKSQADNNNSEYSNENSNIELESEKNECKMRKKDETGNESLKYGKENAINKSEGASNQMIDVKKNPNFFPPLFSFLRFHTATENEKIKTEILLEIDERNGNNDGNKKEKITLKDKNKNAMIEKNSTDTDKMKFHSLQINIPPMPYYKNKNPEQFLDTEISERKIVDKRADIIEKNSVFSSFLTPEKNNYSRTIMNSDLEIEINEAECEENTRRDLNPLKKDLNKLLNFEDGQTENEAERKIKNETVENEIETYVRTHTKKNANVRTHKNSHRNKNNHDTHSSQNGEKRNNGEVGNFDLNYTNQIKTKTKMNSNNPCYSNTISKESTPNAIGNRTHTELNRTYLLLSAQPILGWKLFSKYIQFLSYFTSKDGLFVHFFNGFLYGTPPLDLQNVKRILQFDKNYNQNENIFHGNKKDGDRNSFYRILNLVFENEKKSDDEKKFNLNMNVIPNDMNLNEEEILLNKNFTYDAENQIFEKKNFFNAFSTDTKIHRRLNKTLFFFVLITYVFCCTCSTCGMSLFFFSLTSIRYSDFRVFSRFRKAEITKPNISKRLRQTQLNKNKNKIKTYD